MVYATDVQSVQLTYKNVYQKNYMDYVKIYGFSKETLL